MTITLTNEKDVKREVKKLLDKHGYFWWMPPANGYGKVGISDINAIKAGVFIAIETKFGTKQPTPMQTAFLNSIRAQDAFGFVVSDRTLGWLAVWLEAFDRAVAAQGRGEEVAPEDGAVMLDAIRALTLCLP